MILTHPETLTHNDKRFLLRSARKSLDYAVRGERYQCRNIPSDLPALKLDAATFVTLEMKGELRGCIGKLLPVQPIAEDVVENTHDAAMRDFRFSPVISSDTGTIKIKISVLSSCEDIHAESEEELIEELVPFRDGVVFTDGKYKSTFLPSVWEKVPDPAEFIKHLKQKAGLHVWQQPKNPRYQRYYAVEFSE